MPVAAMEEWTHAVVVRFAFLMGRHLDEVMTKTVSEVHERECQDVARAVIAAFPESEET